MKKSSGLHTHTHYWLRRLSDLAQSRFVEKLNQADMSWSEWAVLVTLFKDQAHSPAAIATHIGVDRAAVTRTVDRLVRRGFIERTKAEDRRRTILNLTDKATSIVPRLARFGDLNDDDFFGFLSVKEQALLRKLVGKVLKAQGVHPSEDWRSK